MTDETEYLLSTEANKKALEKSIKQAYKKYLYPRPEKSEIEESND